MKKSHELFEKSLNHLISVMKNTEKNYFLRESDIKCFMYKDLFNRFGKNKSFFADYKDKKLYLIRTEHQYYTLDKSKPFTGWLKNKSADFVVLANKKPLPIEIAMEIKFSTPVKDDDKKQSAGEKTLNKDIIKLKKYKAHYKYMLYYKEEGNCFITSGSKGYSKSRIKFFEYFKKLKNFKMYYIEKEDDKSSKPKFYLYTIKKSDCKLAMINKETKLSPKKHFNIIIYSNSQNTYDLIQKDY